jgi:hypothetical protein
MNRQTPAQLGEESRRAVTTLPPTGGMPANRGKAVSLTEFRHSGMMVRQEERGAVPKLKDCVPNVRRRGAIDPVLKAWIDNVIVPALADQWAARQASGMASA